MTEPIDTRYVRLGMDQPRAGLLTQGAASVELAKAFAVELFQAGWDDDSQLRLEHALATLSASIGGQAGVRDDARSGTAGETAGRTRAKAFIRKLRKAVPMALRQGGTALGLTEASFESGGQIGRATATILGYLARVRPAVATLDAGLAKFFGGASALDELDACAAELGQADAVQEVSLGDIPEATQRVYEAKGRLLELINDLNRVGCIAFDGDAVTRARFNKDILLRARKARDGAVATTTL